MRRIDHPSIRFFAISVLSFGICFCAEARSSCHVTESDSLAFANAEWSVTKHAKGARSMTASIPMFGDVEYVSVYSYPMRRMRTEIIEVPPMGDITSAVGIAEGAKAALNAGYFDMKKLVSTVFLRLDGQTKFFTHYSEDYRVNGMLSVKGRRVAIGWRDELFCDADALGSGPVLIKDGKTMDYSEIPFGPKSFFDYQHPRTFIGIDQDSDRVFFVVIDGRFPGRGVGASIEQTAAIARWLGLEDALNLDGGGSCSLWVEGEGVLNHPYDNRKFDHDGERKVPTVIIAR